MRIEKTDNINFGTNIRVISPNAYRAKTLKMFAKRNCRFIDWWEIKPTDGFKRECFCGYRKNMELGFTNDVRTCTAGVVANGNEKAPLFFHLLNSKKNKEDLGSLKECFQGTNAILVGSKDGFTYSKDIFEGLKGFARERRLPLTIFQSLAPRFEACLAYESQKDTLYMCVRDAIYYSRYVETMDELKSVFRTVEISETDNIEFGEKSIVENVLSWLKKIFN